MKLTPQSSDWRHSKSVKRSAIVATIAGTLALLIYLPLPESTVIRATITNTPASKLSDLGATALRPGIATDEGGFSIQAGVAPEGTIIPAMPDGLVRALASQPQRLLRMQAAFQRWYQDDPRLASKLIDLFVIGSGFRNSLIWSKYGPPQNWRVRLGWFWTTAPGCAWQARSGSCSRPPRRATEQSIHRLFSNSSLARHVAPCTSHPPEYSTTPTPPSPKLSADAPSSCLYRF